MKIEPKALSEPELVQCFWQAYDKLQAEPGLNPFTAFDELSKLLAGKLHDETNGAPYQFQAKADETAQALHTRIQNLCNESVHLSPGTLKNIVQQLAPISLSLSHPDSLGKAFEALISSRFRGNFGQYFTPRNIVQFMVKVLPLGSGVRVLDPACGSGSFLLEVLRRQPKAQVHGIELNHQVARIARLSLGKNAANILTADGLLTDQQLNKKSGHNAFSYGSFDVVLANPPFGVTIKKPVEVYACQPFELAHKIPDWLDIKPRTTPRTSQSTEVLFIEQCGRFLKPDGWLAMVVPDGILANSGLQYVRNYIEDRFRIVAIVSLPPAAFAHSGAGVKSSVIVLRKYDEATAAQQQQIKRNLQESIKKTLGGCG